MISRNFVTTLLAGCAVAALTVNADSAYAQSSGDGAFAIEEIIVTARKRGENLQDVPATITAFTADDLDNMGVSSMRDYAKIIPNFFLVETQNSGFTFVNIRGITQMRNLDSSVAVVIDGVLSTSPIGMSQELFDIQQIEVLKGPQGALYGRNAMAGAINITTKRPTNELEGFVRAGYGNGQSFKGQAAISGPIIEDSLYGRVAVSYYNTDGLRENITTGVNADKAENVSARGRLLWEKSDKFEADLRVSFSDDNTNALQFTDVSAIFHETAPGSGVSLGVAIGAFSCPGPTCGLASAGPVVSGDRSFFDDPFNQPIPIGVGNINNTTVPLQNNLNGIDRRRLYNISLLMNWDLEVGTLTSTSSWDKVTNKAMGEQPPRTAIASQKNSQYRNTEAWSQEIRLTSPDEQDFRWIVGAYFVATDAFLSTTVQRDFDGIDSLVDFVTRDPFAITPGVCVASPLPPGSAGDNQGNCVMSFDGDDASNTAFAVFAQFNYDVSETLELSVSLRYDSDKRKQTILTPDQFLAFPTDLAFGDTRSATFDSFQPKITLRWMLRENITTYVTYAQGFRSGGFNRPGIGDRANFLRPILGEDNIPLGVEDLFAKQETKSFEGGIKYNSLNGRFVVNAAAFYTIVDDYQTFTFNAFLAASQIIIPIDEVELYGVEIDATLLLAEGLSVSASYGYTNSEVTKDSARGLVGNWAPQTPRTTANVGVQYERPITIGSGEGSIFLRADYQRIGSLFFVPENFSKRDPLNLFSARAGLNFGEGLQVAVWSKNLSNENYFAEGFNPSGLFFYGKLREWGVEITKRF